MLSSLIILSSRQSLMILNFLNGRKNSAQSLMNLNALNGKNKKYG